MKLKRFIIGLTLMSTFAMGLGLTLQPAMAAENINNCRGSNCLDPVSQKRGDRNPLGIPDNTAASIVKSVISVLSAAAGALSVIYLVVGGIKYSSSNGDSGRIQSAKNTITYAIIGLVVSITAGMIVGFVIGSSPSG